MPSVVFWVVTPCVIIWQEANGRGTIGNNSDLDQWMTQDAKTVLCS
jgi:hypothetical protein